MRGSEESTEKTEITEQTEITIRQNPFCLFRYFRLFRTLYLAASAPRY